MDNEFEIYTDRLVELTHRIICNIDDFNSHFDGCERNFLYGNCYWYARILQERFSPWFKTDIMYNQIDNHFCCRLETAAGRFYADIRGVFATGKPDGWVLWKNYINEEPLDAARVYRDCIWHFEEEQWDDLPSKFREESWNLGKSVITEK